MKRKFRAAFSAAVLVIAAGCGGSSEPTQAAGQHPGKTDKPNKAPTPPPPNPPPPRG